MQDSGCKMHDKEKKTELNAECFQDAGNGADAFERLTFFITAGDALM